MVKEHSNSWYIYESNPRTPISTTHESLKNGIEMRTKIRFISRKQLNFHSYPMDDRLGLYSNEESVIPEIPTSYCRDYQPPYPSKCKPREIIEDMPDYDFNRKPVNNLLMIPSVATKFMDDPLINTSEVRRKINFFRQLRAVSNWKTPISETHESLKTGIEMKAKTRIIARKQLNFHSYPMDDASVRFATMNFDKPHIPEILTSYNRDYPPPYTSVCKPKNPHNTPMPDEAFNSKPVNTLIMDLAADSKFMDDPLTNISESRKKINFFRQLRNQSFKFGE